VCTGHRAFVRRANQLNPRYQSSISDYLLSLPSDSELSSSTTSHDPRQGLNISQSHRKKRGKAQVQGTSSNTHVATATSINLCGLGKSCGMIDILRDDVLLALSSPTRAISTLLWGRVGKTKRATLTEYNSSVHSPLFRRCVYAGGGHSSLPLLSNMPPGRRLPNCCQPSTCLLRG